jgi:hypothetical protein
LFCKSYHYLSLFWKSIFRLFFFSFLVSIKEIFAKQANFQLIDVLFVKLLLQRKSERLKSIGFFGVRIDSFARYYHTCVELRFRFHHYLLQFLNWLLLFYSGIQPGRISGTRAPISRPAMGDRTNVSRAASTLSLNSTVARFVAFRFSP